MSNKFLGTYKHADEYQPSEYTVTASGSDAKSGSFLHKWQTMFSPYPGEFDDHKFEASGTWKLSGDSIDLSYITLISNCMQKEFKNDPNELKTVQSGNQKRAPLNVKIKATSGELDFSHEKFKFTAAA